MNKYTIQIQPRQRLVVIEASSEVEALIEAEERLPQLIDWQVISIKTPEGKEIGLPLK